MTEKEKAQAGYFYNANYDEEILKDIHACNDLCYEFNQIRPSDRDAQTRLLAQIFGSMGEHVFVNAPLWCDYGYNTTVGAGSVVTKDIPSGVIAFGVPCRVQREITEEDKKRYPIFEE